MIALYRAGWTVQMVAAVAGLAPVTVHRVLVRAGVPRRGRWG